MDVKEKELLEAMMECFNRDPVVEIPVNTFVGVWFSNEQLTDKIITRRLLDFSKENNFDYVSVMNAQMQVYMIRFWKNKEIKQLEEGKEDAI